MIHRPSVIRLVVALGLALLGTQAVAESSVKQDGVAAELRLVDDNAILRWRLTDQLDQPIREISASYRGRPLGIPTLQPYPGPGEETQLLMLLDATAPDGENGMLRQVAAMLLLVDARAEHHQLALGSFGQNLALIVPSQGVADFATGLSDVEHEDVSVDLTEVIRGGLAVLRARTGQRRALYLFTDGHSRVPVAEAALTDELLAAGVALVLVMQPSERVVDHDVLRRMTRATGGRYVRPEDLRDFLSAGFAFLDNGAVMLFPTADLRSFPWEGRSDIAVAMQYGDKALRLSVPFEARPADLGEVAHHVWASYRTQVLAGSSAMVLAALGGLVFALRRKPAERPGRAPAARTAGLIEQQTGIRHQIASDLVYLGRDASNDIVLADTTVSRRHALICWTGETYVLRNEDSRNGLFVNGQATEEAPIHDGDFIELGSCRLMFQVPNETV